MTSAVKFCTKCGAKLGEVRFCEACGAAVAAPPPPTAAPAAQPLALTPVAPAPAVVPAPAAAPAMPVTSSPQAAPRSCFGIFSGWVIVIGAIFWILPAAARYLSVHYEKSELLVYIIATVLCFAAGCAVIAGAARNKLLFAGILALLFGTLSILDMLGHISGIQFVIEDPLGTFKDDPEHKVRIIAFAAGSIFGDFLIALGCLFTFFAWIGSVLTKR